jgi:Tfp pilus assembly PilM family ATPase
MAFAWTRPRYSPIAVDFGAHSLKLLQIVPGDPPQLVAAASIRTPDSAAHDAAARHAFYRDAIADALRNGPFKGKRAVCSTPAHQTLIQHLQLTPGENGQLADQIDNELRSRLSIEPSRMVVRHFDVGTFVRNGSPRQEIICIAASRDAVMRYLHIAGSAGLDVGGMICEPQALLRSFAHLFRRKTDGDLTTCFLDLGASTVKVVIAHGAQMVSAKTIPLAGDMNDAPATADPDMPVLESKPTFEPIGAAATSTATETQTATSETVDCLVDELQLCLRYHRSMFADRSVERVVFVGGAARHVPRCEQIARALGINAQLGDPLARLARSSRGHAPDGLDMRQPQPGWAVPMGLCLSHV